MNFLAIDLGAESGRAMLGALDRGRLTLEELHRFPNTPVQLPTGLHWDVLRLFHEIRHSLFLCGRQRSLVLDGVAVDTWGVDFALLDANGALLENPRHYRDARHLGMLEKTFAAVPRERIFEQTGIQFLHINTLCQWYSMRLADSPVLGIARHLLFIPDLFNFWLTGAVRAELTVASTSQFHNPVENRWAASLLRDLGLDPALLPEAVPPGTRLGDLLPELQQSSGFLRPVPVYTAASHDTASAVAAVPAEGSAWCYISSGTWSLLGAEVDAPIINEDSLALNFTNEAGAGGKTRLLKNLAGLWLLQECRRAWALEGREYSYEQLASMAASAPSTGPRIDPNAFSTPGDMPQQIAAHCRALGHTCPEDPGALARMILESLAEAYRKTIDDLERLIRRRIEVVHIVGGGSRNRLLNQLTANATGRTVVAGPAEATAAGNVLVQALGAGAVSGLDELRAIVRRSFTLETYRPEA